MEFLDDAPNLIDARGQYVPLPMEDIKFRLADPDFDYLVTVVDNGEDRDAVVAMARDMNLRVKVYNEESGYYIRIDKEEVPGLPTELATDFQQTILVTSNRLGQGESILGSDLMETFLSKLTGSDTLPSSIIFVNSGVFLVCEGSVALSELMALERRNVRIFACEKSLIFYGLKEKICVGCGIRASTMVNYLCSATKVITLG